LKKKIIFLITSLIAQTWVHASKCSEDFCQKITNNLNFVLSKSTNILLNLCRDQMNQMYKKWFWILFYFIWASDLWLLLMPPIFEWPIFHHSRLSSFFPSCKKVSQKFAITSLEHQTKNHRTVVQILWIFRWRSLFLEIFVNLNFMEEVIQCSSLNRITL